MKSKWLVAVSAVLALVFVCGLCSVGMCGVSMVLHYDADAETSFAEILDSSNEQIATKTWGERLPNGYSPSGTETYIQTVVLGYLRDEAEASENEEADQAVTWLKGMMEPYDETPTSEISPTLLSTLSATEESWWCGQKISGSTSKCPNDCTSPGGPKVCSECGCAGHKSDM